MRKNIKILVASLTGAFLFATLVGVNTKRVLRPGQFDPDEGAYYASDIKSKTGLIKAKKMVVPSDNKYSSQKNRSFGTNNVGDIESVWDVYKGSGTKIAIIDDGFDVNHPEYRRSDGTSAILSASRYYYTSNNQVYFNSNIDEDWVSSAYQWDTHGTNTSTTAAAPMSNGGGVGIAPEADILALKIDMSFGAIEEAIKYAIEQGVDVINMSIGAYADFNFKDGFGEVQNPETDEYGTWTAADYAEIADYLESACRSAYNAGIIVVAAAGNEATWHKSYPACNYGVVGVGAVGENDAKSSPRTLAEFTNYVKSNQTGEINVDILAPGYVYTAHKLGTQSSITHGYDDTQGTSFSSPIVAGAACLWKEKNPSGTPSQFLSKLQSSADDIGYFTNRNVPVSGWDSSCSDVGPSAITNGRINVGNLMDIGDPYVTTVENSLSISVSEKKQIHLSSYNGTVTYRSNNTNVATVNENTGLVEGKSAGDTTITVTATKDNKTATATVSVHVAAAIANTSISFSPKSVTLSPGETYDAESTISVTPSNASRIFLFESKDTSVATVDEDTGLVTAVGEGTTDIDVIAGYGSGSDTLSVTVTSPTNWTKVVSNSGLTDGDYLIVYEGGSLAFNGGLSTLDAGSNTISVTISDSEIEYTPETEAAKFTINEMSGGYSIKSASGSYIYGQSGSNVLNTSSSAQANAIDISSGDADIVSNTSHLRFNSQSGQERFRYFKSASYASQNAIQLYKLGAGSTPTPQPEKTLSSISIKTVPTKTTYTEGEKFDPTGLVITRHFSDSTSDDYTYADHTNEFGFDPSLTTSLQTSDTSVKITYGGKDAYQSITVNSSGGATDTTSETIIMSQEGFSNSQAVTSISTRNSSLTFSQGTNASNAPKYYESGEALRMYGGNTVTISSDKTIVGIEFTFGSSDGSNTITASKGSYSNGIWSGSSNEVTFTIGGTNGNRRISEIKIIYEDSGSSEVTLSSITLDTTNVQTVFTVGDPFTYSGLVVTAHYSDSSTATITSGYTVSSPSMTTTGTKTITVTYQEKTATYQITVNAAEVILSSISVDTAPTKVTYTEGEYFEPTGLVIKRTYSDSSFNTYTYDGHSSEFTFSPSLLTALTTSDTFIEITFGGKSTTQAITVNASGSQQAESGTVKYEPSTTSSAEVVSGTAPAGSSVSFNNTYTTTKEQITNNNSQTWTFSGYNGYKITSVVLHMKRNSIKGYGSLSLTNAGLPVSLGKSIGSRDQLTSSYSEYEILSSSFDCEGNIVITITANESSVYCDYILLSYESNDTSDKIIRSLSASYTGPNIYVGDTFDTSNVVVTATFTDSTKYPDKTLDSSDYNLSSVNTTTAGQKSVTVTYTGSLETETSPMTTTFNFTVLNDTITNVTVTNSKTYHPGETIVKSDIYVIVTYESGKTSHPTDFTFANDGYMFTYADTNSGGSAKSKQFSISYSGQNYNFNVNISRVAYQTVSETTKTLSSSDFNDSNVSKSSSTPSNTSVTIGGVNWTVTTNAYIFQNNYTYYLSFNKGAGSIVNTSAFMTDLISVSFTQKNGARQDGVLKISKDGSNWVTYSTSEIGNGGYRYFKIEYESASTASGAAAYSNIQNITYTLSGADNPTNVANYIMYEDTNNQCLTKLDLAIDKLNTMSSSDKSTFWTSDDYVISTARERITAWARHEGKTLDYTNNNFVVSSAGNLSISAMIENSSGLLVIVPVLLIGLTSVGGYFYLKKRKSL